MRKTFLQLTIIALGTLTMTTPATAAQLNLLASTAVQTVLEEVLAQHERASGDKIAVTIASTAAIIDEPVARPSSTRMQTRPADDDFLFVAR